MFFYVNDIVFAFTASRERNAENLIRRLKDIFDMRDLNSLNFFLDQCDRRIGFGHFFSIRLNPTNKTQNPALGSGHPS
jgi:hypothetical protein